MLSANDVLHMKRKIGDEFRLLAVLTTKISPQRHELPGGYRKGFTHAAAAEMYFNARALATLTMCSTNINCSNSAFSDSSRPSSVLFFHRSSSNRSCAFGEVRKESTFSVSILANNSANS